MAYRSTVEDGFEVVAASSGIYTFGDYVTINRQGEVSYRRRAGTGLAYDIMRNLTRIAFATTATNDPYNRFFKNLWPQTDINTPLTGEAEVSFYGDVLESNGYTLHHQIRKGDGSGPQGYYVSHTTLIASQPEFSSFGTSTSINDAGRVVFTGSHSDPTNYGNGVFIGDGSYFSPVATTATGFTATGSCPSINNVERVAFYGTKAFREGVYLWHPSSPTELRTSIGDPVFTIEPASRIAFNDHCDLAFVGNTAGGIRALFRDCGWGPTVIIKIGDAIGGTAPIDGLELWDSLNWDAEVVFWTHHGDGSEALWVAENSTPSLGCGQPWGRVIFADKFETPISGAEVQAYDIATYQRIGQPSYTDQEGRYQRPDSFTDPNYQGGTLGLWAKISYDEPATGMHFEITNYPNNDPFPPAYKITGIETISFPLPVVLQAGLFGGVDVGTWNAFAQYLRLISAASTGTYSKNTGSLKLPAFLTFVMPSNDTQLWGYHDGLPMSHHPHDINVNLLDDFVTNRVRGALAALVPDQTARDRLSINLCAHSMGGIITRGWMHDKRPAVARYVSFDGVQGGTSFFLRLGRFGPGMAEWYMNGWNVVPFLPPLIRGWNYAHAMPTKSDILLLSSSCFGCVTVDPNCSALGVGRTMLAPFVDLPNRHKARFIGGVEWHTSLSHSGTHDDPGSIYQVTRFLAYGAWPEGSYRSGSAYDCQDQPPPLSRQGIPGEYWAKLTAEPQGVVVTAVHIDDNAVLDVSVLTEGVGAVFDLIGPGGQSLIPPDPDITDLGGAQSITFPLGAPPIGLSTFKLTAADQPVTAYVSLIFRNERRLVLDCPVDPIAPAAGVPISASLQDSAGAPIVGSGGVIQAEVTLPDESEQMVTLFDDGGHGDGVAGDGIYATAFAATTLGGRYVVSAHAQIALGGETIERSATAMFVVNSSPASLVGVTAERPVDATGDGKYDRLEFDIDVSIDEPGDYQVRAFLEDSNQNEIAEDYQEFDIPPGMTTHTATIEFDGGTLVAHGVPGPWTLTRIELFDNDQALLADTLDDVMTAAYDLADFSPPPDPVLTQVLPDYGRVQGGNEIILQGVHLEYVSAISLGGNPVDDFDIWSDSAIRLTVPPAPGLLSGPVDLELATAWTGETFLHVYRYWPRLGDLNGDSNVDLADLGLFGTCLAGPSVTTPPDGCAQGLFENCDLDGDDDVDLVDFGSFESRFGGPE